MPESLLKYRFRGTTLSCSELIVALENIIIDKVAMVPTAKGKKHDTSAPMAIGTATKEDSENASQEGDQRIIDFALQAVYKGARKGKWSFGKGQHWNEKGGKGGKDGGKRLMAERQWARKEAKDKRRVAKMKTGRAVRMARQDILPLGAGKEERRTCTPWTKVNARTPKNTQSVRLKVKKICRHGACWKRAKVSSGKK